MQERGTITLNFPAQVKSITSDCLSQTVTTSGQYMTSTDPKDYTFTCKLEEGYKISGIDFTDGTGGYNSLSGFTDNTFTISISGSSDLTSTVGINVSEVQKVQKSISLDNLAQFKANCDQTYAKVGESTGANVVENPILSLFTKDTATLNFSALGQEVYVEYYYFKENQNPVNIPITATLSFSDLDMNIPVTNVLELYAALNIFGYVLAGAGQLPSTKVTGISGIQNTLVQNTTIVTAAFNVVSGTPDLETPAFVANSFIMKKFPSSTFIDFQLDFGEYLVEIDLNSIEDTYLTISTIQMVAGNRTLPLPSPSTAGQVPVVNAAGNGYELQAQSSGGITQSTVIERPEELPTATADSPDFVEVGGVLYRKKAVEGGVAGVITSSTIKGVFNINYSPSVLDARVSQTINFSSNNEDFSSFFADFTRGETLQYGGTTVYNGSWTNSAYRTVNFGNEEQPVNGSFYDYFRQVAYPVTPSVSYEYVAQQDAGGGGGTPLYCHRLRFGTDSDCYHVINNSSSPMETLQDLKDNQLYIVGWLKVDTSWAPVIGYFDGLLVYINFTGNWTGVTGAAFATKEIASGTTISDTVNPL